jgi:hypothetical protein
MDDPPEWVTGGSKFSGEIEIVKAHPDGSFTVKVHVTQPEEYEGTILDATMQPDFEGKAHAEA